MDPAITATVISAPIAVLAAGASYAAGRLQARGAHRGPVDAVRRQHQRDAYAALLAAANAVWVQTSPQRLLNQARAELSGSESTTLAEVNRRAAVIALRTSADDVFAALAVVTLEGPEHVIEAATEIMTALLDLQGAMTLAKENHSIDVLTPEHQALAKAIAHYVAMASLHLNNT